MMASLMRLLPRTPRPTSVFIGSQRCSNAPIYQSCRSICLTAEMSTCTYTRDLLPQRVYRLEGVLAGCRNMADHGHAHTIARAGALFQIYPVEREICNIAKRQFCTLTRQRTSPQLFLTRQNQVPAEKRFVSEQSTNFKSTKAKWMVYLTSTVLVFLSGIFSYFKYRQYSIRRRGVRIVSMPHFSYQSFFPFGWYKGIFISTALLDNIEKAEDFPVRKDDVFVISFPRSGTTWTQELVYLITNDADITKAKARSLEERSPYLEDHFRPMEELAMIPSPRLIKSHLPYRLLPTGIQEEKPKLIYVMRNPKDAVVSFYHLWQKLRGKYNGTFEDYCELFFKDEILFGPWFEHVKGFWEVREHDNILFLKYEDLQKDLDGEVRRIARFLGKTLTDKQVESIVEHCSFGSMKQNDMVNYQWWDKTGVSSNMGTDFIRKGKVGDWKNYFSPELDARMNEKIVQPLDKIGLTVDYEIDTRD